MDKFTKIFGVLTFAASGVMVGLVVDTQLRMEKRLKEMQEIRDHVESSLYLSGNFRLRMKLAREKREKVVAFLKNNAAGDPDF